LPAHWGFPVALFNGIGECLLNELAVLCLNDLRKAWSLAFLSVGFAQLHGVGHCGEKWYTTCGTPAKLIPWQLPPSLIDGGHLVSGVLHQVPYG